MKIGIAGANSAAFAERDQAIALARAAEAAGVESLWTYEHIVIPAGIQSAYPYSPGGRMPDARFPDALDWIAFLSGVTEHIMFGTGMLILPEHNPVILAKRAATIDRLSGGRLLLGVGVGWMKEEFDALAVPWENRGRRAEEYIQAMRHLWAGDQTAFAGSHVRFQPVHCFPKPIQARGIPVIIGGHSQAAAARAGRIGDGFYPPAAPPERVAELIRIMHRSAQEAGRDPASIEITAGAAPDTDTDTVKRYQDLGVARVVISLPAQAPSGLQRSFDALHESLISQVSLGQAQLARRHPRALRNLGHARHPSPMRADHHLPELAARRHRRSGGDRRPGRGEPAAAASVLD
jgi:probable F420-dependent oxidoreductase